MAMDFVYAEEYCATENDWEYRLEMKSLEMLW